MIRWSYVLPRLAVLAAGALFVAFGLDPLIRWGLFWGGQKMLGAKVEIAAVRTSLPRGRIRLQGLQVANPKAPLKNLFQAEQLLLDFDANALLRRRLVVDQAYVSGLKIDGERTESGELPAGTLGRPEAASPFDSLGFDADWTRRFSVQVLKDAARTIAREKWLTNSSANGNSDTPTGHSACSI